MEYKELSSIIKTVKTEYAIIVDREIKKEWRELFNGNF